MSSITPELKDVPETMLWTLRNRAVEALRADSIFQDADAIRIYRSIVYDFDRSFGPAEPSSALRAVYFDKQVAGFLKQHPNGVIINLGEGLETQRYRIESNMAAKDAQWFTVDLPDAIAIREQFIAPDAQHTHLACSATDPAWFEHIPTGRPILITAQGLFMYLPESVVRKLFQDLSIRFPNAWLVFDTMPRWMSEKTQSEEGWQKTPHYRMPTMHWGINDNEIEATVRAWIPDIQSFKADKWPDYPRGVLHWLIPLMKRIPPARRRIPDIVRLQFSAIADEE